MNRIHELDVRNQSLDLTAHDNPEYASNLVQWLTSLKADVQSLVEDFTRRAAVMREVKHKYK